MKALIPIRGVVSVLFLTAVLVLPVEVARSQSAEDEEAKSIATNTPPPAVTDNDSSGASGVDSAPAAKRDAGAADVPDTDVITNNPLGQVDNKPNSSNTNSLATNAAAARPPTSAQNGTKTTAASLARKVHPPKVNLPPQLAGLVRMAQQGMSEDVLLAYVRQSDATQPITADQLLYLRDVGISSRVLTELLEHRPLEQAEAVTAPSDWDELDTDTNAVPIAPVAPPVPQVVADYGDNSGDFGYFYDSLAPYGSWLDLPSIGWCWQPSVCRVNRHWRPYCDNGQWVWSDCGWFWNSQYSWGWAPFHYGRWWQHPNYGWMWRPDRVWGPSWVCWRQGNDFCGWAPLPPGANFHTGKGWTLHGARVGSRFGFGLPESHFTFVPFSRFTQKFVNSPFAPATLTKPFMFKHSFVNNDFFLGPNRHFFNRGIDPKHIEFATHTPLHQTPIRHLLGHRFHGSSFATSTFAHSQQLRPVAGPPGTASQSPWTVSIPDPPPGTPRSDVRVTRPRPVGGPPGTAAQSPWTPSIPQPLGPPASGDVRVFQNRPTAGPPGTAAQSPWTVTIPQRDPVFYGPGAARSGSAPANNAWFAPRGFAPGFAPGAPSAPAARPAIPAPSAPSFGLPGGGMGGGSGGGAAGAGGGGGGHR